MPIVFVTSAFVSSAFMPLDRDRLRSAGKLLVGLIAVIGAARLLYGPAPADPPIEPAPETVAGAEAGPLDAGAEPDPTEAVVARLGSGETDFIGVMTTDGSEAEFDAFEQSIGRSPDVLQIAVGWELDRFDPGRIQGVVDRGALPSIGWEPWDYRPYTWDQPRYSLARILDGGFDDYIDEWAKGLAELGRPVLMRFAHEPNGDWYPWSESRNGNQPGEYVAAWRYVHDRFEAAGADNVIWVWSPNVNPLGTYPLAGLYPGDDYVDLVGLVGYWGHFGTTPTAAGTFESVFGSSIEEIRTMTQKPIFISETGASEEGGFKPEWIESFLRAVAERPDVVGFVWFEANKESDWRIGSSPESLAVFVEGLRHPAFDR